MTEIYSGINSKTFLEYFNPESRTFNKSNTGMRYPDKIFFYNPYFALGVGKRKIIHHYACGEIARVRAEKWGGIPIVFSAEYPQSSFLYELNKSGKERKRRLILEQQAVRVNSIYLVTGTVRNICTLLKDISYEELQALNLNLSSVGLHSSFQNSEQYKHRAFQ